MGAYDGSLKPNVQKLLGLRPMIGGAVTSVMRAQDHVPASSRRMLLRYANGDDTTLRWVGELTPGCFPSVSVVAEPNGSVGNCVTVTTIFYPRTGPSETITTTVPAPAGAAIASVAGRSFLTSQKIPPTLIVPSNLIDTSVLSSWCQNVTVEISVTVNANVCRDVIVYEQPYEVAMEAADDSDHWTSHIISLGSIENPAQQSSVPVDRFNDTTDPRGGSDLLLDVRDAQELRMGPTLICWSGLFDAPNSDAAVHNVNVTAYDSTNEGFSVSCGGYARNWIDNSDFVLRGRTGVIPVRLWTYVSVAGAGGIVRVQSADDSWVELTATATGLWTTTGFLEVGLNCDDFRVAQIFARDDGTDFSVEFVAVEYCQDTFTNSPSVFP